MRNNFEWSACFGIFLLVIFSGRWMEQNKAYGMKWMGQITTTKWKWWLLDMNIFFWSSHLKSPLAKPLAHGIFLPVFEECSSEDLLTIAEGALQNYILYFLFFFFSLKRWHKRNCYLHKERIKLVVDDLKVAVYATDHSGLLVMLCHSQGLFGFMIIPCCPIKVCDHT